MTYVIYILECSDGTYYIGNTNNLEKRLREHNGELSGGAKYTRSRRPVRVVYCKNMDSESSALKKEIELKKLTRSQKKSLILS